MQPLLRVLALAAVAWFESPALAQVIAVDQIEKSWLVRSVPTLTALRPAGGSEPRAVLMMMPGGEGQIGLRPDAALDTSPPRTSFVAVPRRLVDPQLTSGAVHVVAVDSPYDLGYGAQLPLRATRDHFVRMESVAQFYRARLGLPIWVMGHSNGGYSIAEFAKYLQDRKKEDLVAGLVFSAARTISDFGSGPFRWPALFVVSAEDGCTGTSAEGNQKLYQRFKERNAAPTEFVLVRSAQPEGGDPCRTGTHMYHRAEEEVAKILDDFIARHTPPPTAPR
jgi:pimeloyl-ACP methyl ester carboxylesterase